MALFFFSCKPFKEAECTGVKDFKINNINTEGLDATIVLGIKNPNAISFSIYPSDFDVKLSGINLGKAKIKRRVRIKSNTEENYSFHLKSSFKDLNLADVMKLMGGGNFGSVHVKGDLKAGKFYLKKSIPVDVKEKLMK